MRSVSAEMRPRRAGDVADRVVDVVDGRADALERLAGLLDGRDAVLRALGALADDLDHARGLALDLAEVSPLERSCAVF
jgi:hypothetical protein